MQALALNKRQSFMPMPSKRASSAAVAASHHKPAASTEQRGSGGPFSELLQPFNGLFSRTTWVSRYQKGKTNLDFTGARDSE